VVGAVAADSLVTRTVTDVPRMVLAIVSVSPLQALP
jgi:hypothetical protein